MTERVSRPTTALGRPLSAALGKSQGFAAEWHCASRGVSKPSPMSCAPRQASRGYGVNKAGTEALDLLAPVYGWFTEGFDSADLKAAKALLDQLA
jgi:hypothetical protein